MFANNMLGLALPLLILSALFSPLSSAQSISTTAMTAYSVSTSYPPVDSFLGQSNTLYPDPTTTYGFSTSTGPNGVVTVPIVTLPSSLIPTGPVATIADTTFVATVSASESVFPSVPNGSSPVVVGTTAPLNASIATVTTTASTTSLLTVNSTEATVTATTTKATMNTASLAVVTTSASGTATASSSNATVSPTSAAISNRFHRETSLASLAVGMMATVLMATLMT